MSILHIFKLSICYLVFILYLQPILVWARYISSVQYPHVASGYWIDNGGLETDIRESQSFYTFCRNVECSYNLL